jgi:hypothetical protein
MLKYARAPYVVRPLVFGRFLRSEINSALTAHVSRPSLRSSASTSPRHRLRRRGHSHTTSPAFVVLYDRLDPARLSSLMPIAGILLKRLLFVVDDDFAELGAEV